MRFLIGMSLIICFMSGDCLADGDCPSRPATKQEQIVYAAMHAAVKSAIPPAPQDWLMKDLSDAKSGDFMPDCPGGHKDSPHRYSFQYQYKYNSALRNQAAAAAAANAVKGSPEQQARMAALNKKYDQLKVERNQSRKSRDRAEADRIGDEIKKVSAERDRLDEEIAQAYLAKVRSGQMAKEMSAGIPQHSEAQITFFVNADRAWVPKNAEIVDVAGTQYSYWRSDGETLVVLLGSWETTAPTFRAGLARGAVITKPQTVLIEIRAERQMAERLAREIKLNAIRAQLN